MSSQARLSGHRWSGPVGCHVAEQSFPLALTFDDVLLIPWRSDVVPSEVCVRSTFARGMHADLPVMSAAMDTVTEHEMAMAMARAGGLGIIHRNLDVDRQAEAVIVVRDAGLRVGAAIGTSPADEDRRLPLLVDCGCDVIVVDTAHGHSKRVLDLVERVKTRYGNSIRLVAGNVATYGGTMDLISAGADAVKVGVGPSGICTTRGVSGVGVPQLTAIIECSRAAAEHGVPVIADGGIKQSGDITKALAAGASCVMLGGLLAGTDEAPGELVFDGYGRQYKAYRGMGSRAAMEKGSSDRYFQGSTSPDKLVPEGVEGRVRCKGPVKDVLHQLIGGLKSGMGYTGSRNIDELQRFARFVRITNAGARESGVYGIERDSK